LQHTAGQRPAAADSLAATVLDIAALSPAFPAHDAPCLLAWSAAEKSPEYGEGGQYQDQENHKEYYLALLEGFTTTLFKASHQPVRKQVDENRVERKDQYFHSRSW
jgi:hypothetical protein